MLSTQYSSPAASLRSQCALQKTTHASHSPQFVSVRRTGTQLLHVVQAHKQAGRAHAGDGGHEACRLASYTLTLIIRQQLKIHSFRIGHSLENSVHERPLEPTVAHQRSQQGVQDQHRAECEVTVTQQTWSQATSLV